MEIECEQNENINRENFKKELKRNFGAKITITEMKNIIEEFKSRLEWEESANIKIEELKLLSLKNRKKRRK